MKTGCPAPAFGALFGFACPDDCPRSGAARKSDIENASKYRGFIESLLAVTKVAAKMRQRRETAVIVMVTVRRDKPCVAEPSSRFFSVLQTFLTTAPYRRDYRVRA
jgi:hypothetical protein